MVIFVVEWKCLVEVVVEADKNQPTFLCLISTKLIWADIYTTNRNF